MEQEKIRNIAIIAHVDHGKTTLVDQLFRQSGLFRENQVVRERLMDSLDLERERGITIAAKNGSFRYKGYKVNIIDTPGHADFGGQVERVLKMVDGALLLVDAQEGPMPQTFFVLKKALALALPVIVVINKIDKPAARCSWAVDSVFDLFVKLDAPDTILDFPIVYASARDGYAVEKDEIPQQGGNFIPLFEKIIKHVPPPKGDSGQPLQMLVSTVDYSPYLGRLGIGKITSGSLNINQSVAVAMLDGSLKPARITKIYGFAGNKKVPVDNCGVGDIAAVAGMEDITVGVTLTDLDSPVPLPPIQIDPPTISMNFVPNDSPFAGQDGKFVTSRHLKERLDREIMADVALEVKPLEQKTGYLVSGRGELHLSILIERMRREGYEFQVTSPQVILKEENGNVLEPYEELTVGVDEEYMGTVIEKLGMRKGRMRDLCQTNGMARLVYTIPTRGLLGFKSELMSETRGMGVMNYVFSGYDEYAGDIRNRSTGALVSKETCTTAAYALFNLQNRGNLFFGPAEKVYRGQILGERAKAGDLIVNPAKGKKLTNMRAAGSDENVLLTPPTKMSLEDCIAFINSDELVEVTPKAIRMRKKTSNIA